MDRDRHRGPGAGVDARRDDAQPEVRGLQGHVQPVPMLEAPRLLSITDVQGVWPIFGYGGGQARVGVVSRQAFRSVLKVIVGRELLAVRRGELEHRVQRRAKPTGPDLCENLVAGRGLEAVGVHVPGRTDASVDDRGEGDALRRICAAARLVLCAFRQRVDCKGNVVRHNAISLH